jgi:putative endonuclease
VKSYCVYIMASESGVLYIGVTNDLERRVFEHQNKRAPGFAARYNIRKLVYFELFGSVRAAIAREKQLKGWLRRRKIALIESVNPQWKDLSAKCPVAVANNLALITARHSEPTCAGRRGEESLRNSGSNATPRAAIAGNRAPVAGNGAPITACHSERSEESLRNSGRAART